MKTFGQILYSSPSSQLWREAYLYYLIKEFLENFLDGKYPHIDQEKRRIQIFVTQKNLQINLKITSENTQLLAEIKQRKAEIATLLQARLIKQRIITKKFQIIVKTDLI